MLKEFILEQLMVLEKNQEQFQEDIQKLSLEEEEENLKIEKLLEKEDVGMELFSPRSSQRSVKESVEDIKIHIGEIHYKEAEIQEKMEKNALEIEKYQKLLQEAGKKDQNVPLVEIIEETIQKAESGENNSDREKRIIKKEDLESVLKRTELALNYLYSDRAKCKNELKSIRYYLKALLTDM